MLDIINRKYLQHMNLNGFTQALFEPTRIHGNTKTLIDHVFHNKIQSLIIDLTDLCITDHLAKFIELPWALNTTLNTKSIRTKTFHRNTEKKKVFLEDLKIRHAYLVSGLNLSEQISSSVDCLKRAIDDYTFPNPTIRRSP